MQFLNKLFFQLHKLFIDEDKVSCVVIPKFFQGLIRPLFSNKIFSFECPALMIFFLFSLTHHHMHNSQSNICMFSFILFLLKLSTMTHIPCSSTHLSATCVLLHSQFVTYIEKGTKKSNDSCNY